MNEDSTARQQPRTKISQPIALDPRLRDILERNRVIKPPTVPKVELLEKYITVRAWTYEATTKHGAGDEAGTHVQITTPGIDGTQTFEASATTLALAITEALCKALESQPTQAALDFDAPVDLFSGVWSDDHDNDDDEAEPDAEPEPEPAADRLGGDLLADAPDHDPDEGPVKRRPARRRKADLIGAAIADVDDWIGEKPARPTPEQADVVAGIARNYAE